MNPWMPASFSRSFPLTSRMIALSVALVATTWGSATFAQVMVNDPAETIILNSGSTFALPRDMKESGPGAIKPESKSTEKKSDKNDIAPLPVEMQAELDLEKPDSEDALPPPPPADGAIRAKAVMVDINSNTLNYDKDHDVYVATGSVHMIISEQNSELYADKLTYDQNQDLVIAEGSVTIIKDGQKTHGSYAKIDLSRKSALINDYAARVDKVRIKAKNALVNAKFVQYEDGRLIISPDLIRKALVKSPTAGSGKRPPAQRSDFVHDEDITQLGREMEKLELTDESEAGEANAEDNSKKGLFSVKMKQIDVYRNQSGYDRIIGRWPSLYFKGHKIATMPSTEASYDEPSGSMEYLGPDIGYDPDYGGFYAGPGWDFRAGEHGSIRISPLVSYGGGGRRIRGGARYKDRGVGPGVGGVVHYRDPKTFVDLAYNSHVGQPVLLGERKLFDGKTRLRLSANEDYVNGFMGYERPGYGVQITDTRKLAEIGKFDVTSYASAGYYKDEFFPTFEDDWFVKAKKSKPGAAGRAQLQAQIRNNAPLLQVGKWLDFGLTGQALVSGYSTGDIAGLLRGGPSMNLHLGNRFNSSLRYYYAVTAGETPFVFDSYYRGRQNLIWGNSVRVNNYLTLGLRSDMSLNRDNAKNALFTGNQLYMLVGPKEFKVNVAYDVVRKRSYFGVKFFPGNESQGVDFEKMRIFQPEDYNNPVVP